MKIRTVKALDNGVYRVAISTEEFSELDNELMVKHGEPEVDIGGSFTGPPAYTLTTNLTGIKSGSPFKEAFDEQDYVDAEDRANVWASEMVTRIQTALTTLRANVDGFSGETVVTY